MGAVSRISVSLAQYVRYVSKCCIAEGLPAHQYDANVNWTSWIAKVDWRHFGSTRARILRSVSVVSVSTISCSILFSSYMQHESLAIHPGIFYSCRAVGSRAGNLLSLAYTKTVRRYKNVIPSRHQFTSAQFSPRSQKHYSLLPLVAAQRPIHSH